MNLCSALAAGILIFGMCEWMYYVTGTPFGIEPYSVQGYEYASAYGMFHWGFSAWAFYLVAGVAIGYLYWNKKIGDLRISALCSNLIGGDSFPLGAGRHHGILLFHGYDDHCRHRYTCYGGTGKQLAGH